MNIEELELKYIKLLLERCLNIKKSDSLFISYDTENQKFIDKLVEYAKEMGYKDIYLDGTDHNYKHDVLKQITLEEIDSNPLFLKGKWDEYAKKEANFLLLVTEVPGLMEDIDKDKLARVNYLARSSKPIYCEKQAFNLIPWCIAALPGKDWADKLFPNSENAYLELEKYILQMCMIDTEEPVNSWNDYLNEQKKIIDKLNSLKIKRLHYKNSLGTDLYLTMPEGAIWQGAGEGEILFNMPSYEVFASPDYRGTEGVVYSSMPLSYGGKMIDNFFLEFRDGKLVNYKADKGVEVLEELVSEDGMEFLGEVALVDIDSPISKTNLVFDSTLFDENSACHLALGLGFAECLEGGLEMNTSTLKEKGINQSLNHVDFMIGTDDLNIYAETGDGEILIFKNGHFNL